MKKIMQSIPIMWTNLEPSLYTHTDIMASKK